MPSFIDPAPFHGLSSEDVVWLNAFEKYTTFNNMSAENKTAFLPCSVAERRDSALVRRVGGGQVPVGSSRGEVQGTVPRLIE